ncbi:MAG: hypothetical protein GDA52_10070 [Rhodobacteraceae bacterium]|nr:hypothetical protein [Paracoccaceae bacterium]
MARLLTPDEGWIKTEARTGEQSLWLPDRIGAAGDDLRLSIAASDAGLMKV